MDRTNIKSSRWRIVVGLSLAVLLDVPVQLLWKGLMLHAPGSVIGFIEQPITWVLLVLFVLQFLNWMWVLGNADLSYAQPFTAASYAFVSLGGAIFFGEHLSVGRCVGIAGVLIGVVLVSLSPAKTT